MKALIVKARMVANVLHLGGRYEGARTLGECADALETLFAQANEAIARLNEAVAVEKAYGFTIQEFQGDIERERENTRRCQRELNKALSALDAMRFGPRTQDGTDPRCSVEVGTHKVTYCASMAWMLDADDRHFRVGLRVPKRGEAYGAVVIDVKGKRFSFCDYCPFCGAYIATREAEVTR